VAGFFEHGNKPSGIIKGGEYFHLLKELRTLLHGVSSLYSFHYRTIFTKMKINDDPTKYYVVFTINYDSCNLTFEIFMVVCYKYVTWETYA
jgi:hypothetical protein